MMQNRFQQIALASFLIPLFGLLCELFAFPDFSPAFKDALLNYIGFLGYYVHLNFFTVSSVHYYNSVSGITANFLNIGFYVLMLLGASLYVISKQRETRLIRFSFAFMAGANVIGFFVTGISMAIFWRDYVQQSVSFSLIGLFALRRVALVALCLWVLREIQNTKKLSFSTNAAGEDILQSTPKAQRFLHHILDTLFCVTLFSGVNYMLSQSLLRELLETIGERNSLVLLLIVYRIIYYILFESMLSASPAKYLTESRVVTFEGKKIDFPVAIIRTFVRLVPFEPLSFFGKSGWHDLWSKTDVVKEERSGVPGGRYLLIIPTIMLFTLGIYYGQEYYEDYKNYLRAEENHNAMIDDYEGELNHLTPSHFIRIKEISENYSSDKLYLKVDSVYNGKADVSLFTFSESSESPLDIVAYFYSHRESVDKQTVEISALIQALPKDYDEYDDRKDKGATILSGNKKYRIEEVFVEGAPLFNRSRAGYIYDLSINLSIDNCGWPATAIALNNIEGNVKWSKEPPFELSGRTPDYWGCGSFYLDGTCNEKGEHYKAEMEIVDSQGRTSVYILEGSHVPRSLRKKFD